MVHCKVTRRICLISDDMFASQSATKMLLGLNKETIFVIALEKMHILVENWNDVHYRVGKDAYTGGKS